VPQLISNLCEEIKMIEKSKLVMSLTGGAALCLVAMALPLSAVRAEDGYVTRGVKKGADVTVDGTKKGIDTTADGTKKVVRTSVNGTKKGVDYTVGGTKKGIDYTGHGIHKGLDATKHFFKKVF
jgi:hypothetical protein